MWEHRISALQKGKRLIAVMSNISIISVMSVTSVDAVVSVFFLCSDSGQDEGDGVVPATCFIPFPEFKSKNRRRIHSPNKPKLFSSNRAIQVDRG